MKKYLAIMISLILTLATVGCTKTVEQQVAEQLELGQKYLAEMNYEQAIVAFTKVIEIDPKNIEAYFSLSDIYVVMDDMENAVSILEQGYGEIEDAKIEDKLVTLYISQADRLRKDSPEEARDIIERGLTIVNSLRLREYLKDLEDEIREADILHMYQSYYDKLLELQKQYGKESVDTAVYTGGYYEYSLNGLCFAKIIDFDGNGYEELMLAYKTPDSGIGQNAEYILEIWEYRDGRIQKIYDEDCYFNQELYQGIQLYDYNDQYFCGHAEFDAEEYTKWWDPGFELQENRIETVFFLYGYDEDVFIPIHSMLSYYGENAEGTYIIDGETISGNELNGSAAYVQWVSYFENEQSYQLNWYSELELYKTIAELENTFTVLKDKLGLGNEDSADGETGSENGAVLESSNSDLYLYEELLDLFNKGIASQWADYSSDYYTGLDGRISYLWYQYPVQSLADAGYAIQDVDGNGNPELLVSPIEEANRGIIYDLYTYHAGSVVHLVSGGERDQYYLCTDGTIANEGSGGASSSIFAFYTVDSVNDSLMLKESVEYDGYRDEENPWFYRSGDMPDTQASVSITEEEARALIDRFEHESINLIPFDSMRN